MEKQGLISSRVSLDGTKELYLIIVGIGITEALVHTADFKTATDFISYFILLVGYLLTVFRFSLGMINMLSHMAEKLHNHWTQVVSLLALCFLATGLCFYWMGLYLQNLGLFMLNTIVLLAFDLITLFVGHRPWSPPRGWGLWIVWKTFAIWLRYPMGIYDPMTDTKRYGGMQRDKKIIKKTHYQWIRSNFWLGILFMVGLWGWLNLEPIHSWVPNHTPAETKEIFYEIGIGLTLITFAFWDFSVNRIYYFGEADERASL